MSTAPDRPTPAAPPQAAPVGEPWHIVALARLSAHRSAMLVLLVVVTVALVGLVGWRYHEVRRDNEAMFARRATERANAMASQLRDTIAATLLQADVMNGMARLVTEARLSGNANAEAGLRPYLDPAAGRGGPDVVQVFAVGASGALMWSNLDWTPPATDRSDREYFTALVANPAQDSLFGRPVLGRTSKELSVHFARAMRDPAGRLRAITVVALRAGMLARLCRDIALAPGDTVTLLRDDGAVLMRSDTPDLGAIAGTAPPGEREPLETATFSARPGPPGDMPRTEASRRIPGAPLTLHVSLSRMAQIEALAEVRHTLWRFTLFLEGAIVGIAIVGGFAVLLLRRSAVDAARAASLAQSEAWFRSVIDDMADGVLVFDGLGEGDIHITYANRPAGKIFGVPAGQLAGRDFATLVHPADRAQLAERRQAALHGQKLSQVTYRALRSDGASVLFTANSVVSPSPAEPSRLRTITALRDITEEHARDAALADARARTERILQVIPGVFYQLTADPGEAFKPAFVSESVTHLLGVSVDDASRPGFMPALAAIDVRATRQAALDKAGPAGVAVAEYLFRVRGREVWMRDTMRRLIRPDGGAEIVGFLADATAEHAADEARRAAEAELRRLNRALAAYSRSLFALIRSDTLNELVTRVCESIVEEPVYVLACLGLPESSPGLPIRLIGGVGSAVGYIEGLNLSWSADAAEGRGPAGTALREGRPHVMRDSRIDPMHALWRERANRFGIRSSLTVPCRADDRVVGILIIYASEPDAFGPEELGLFEQLSEEIGFAIRLEEDRARLHAAEAARAAAEENQRAAAQLGPGVLYRARVHAAGVEVLHVFGDAARVTRSIAGPNGGPATLGTILARSDSHAAVRALPENSTLSDDTPLEASDGTTCWMRNAVRVTGRRGDAVDVVGYVSEVTQEKEQQLRRQQVTTLLTLGEMATGMAHELNQPLAAISFAAESAETLLGRQPAELDAVAGKLTRIVKAAHRAARLIEHMRVFARNEHEEMRPVSWHSALESALEILSHKLRGCQVVKDVPEDLPEVMGSAIPMEQVLINLISNAVEAYEAAPPEVARVVTVKANVQEGKVVLRVADRAGGIPPHVLSRVFEPFFTTKPPGKGTGLGLGLVFGTIVEMNGTITAGNEDGGAVFEVRLPMVPVRAETVGGDEQQQCRVSSILQ